ENDDPLGLAIQLGIDIVPKLLAINPFHSFLACRGLGGQTGGNRLLRQHLGPRLSADAIYYDGAGTKLQVVQERGQRGELFEPLGDRAPELGECSADEILATFATASKRTAAAHPAFHQRAVVRVDILPSQVVLLDDRATKQLVV